MTPDNATSMFRDAVNKPKTPKRLGGLGDIIYRTLFRRTSTFVLAIIAGGFFFERAFDKSGDAIFEHWNKGKLWKDIKYQYENKEAASEESE